jgi:dihydrofolate reductase
MKVEFTQLTWAISMRRLKYFVAMSLDGYIAGPKGEIDWLFTDQDYGFTSFLKSIDAVLIGRKTYEKMVQFGTEFYNGKENYIFSHTPRTGKYENIQWISQNPGKFVEKLRSKPGKDIWVVGGGILCGYLMDRDLIDNIILAVHPVILSYGIPFIDHIKRKFDLSLQKIKSYRMGSVVLHYEFIR